MQITVNGKRAKKAVAAATCFELLKKLSLSREECIVKVNGTPASDGQKLLPNDKVEVIRIVFGG